MYMQNRKAVQYTSREDVLYYLLQLMEEKLQLEELWLILLHCGVKTASPMDFDTLAVAFNLGTPKIAEQCYNEAILKTRDVIPGSELDECIASYDPAE